MARPPRVDKGNKLPQVNGHSDRVQSKVDDISMRLLDEFEKRIDEKIKDGKGLESADLPELMDGFRKLVKATQRPATSITMIKTGPTLVAGPKEVRAGVISKAASNPEERKALRSRQRKYVEHRQEK